MAKPNTGMPITGGGSLDGVERAIREILSAAFAPENNNTNVDAEKAGATMGEATANSFMEGFKKEFGDTIDEQTADAINKLQGKITEVTGKINNSLKNVKDFNDNSENLDETDIISQYLDKTEKGIDNLLNQIKADIKYRNDKIQELNEVIKAIPEELQERVNNYIGSDATQDYVTDYKESKNKAKTIVANTLKNALKENIKAFTVKDEKQRNTEGKLSAYNYDIDELIEQSTFDELDEEEKDTLKQLYKERQNLIQVYKEQLTKVKSYISYLSKMGISSDQKIFNDKTLSEVEKSIDNRINSLFDMENDFEESNKPVLEKILGKKFFKDVSQKTPKKEDNSSDSAKTSSTKSQSSRKSTKTSTKSTTENNGFKITNVTSTTVEPTKTEFFNIDTPEELVRSVEESSSPHGSGATSMARSAEDVMAEKEALQKKLDAAEQKGYNKGFKEGKAQGKANAVDGNAEKAKSLEEEKALKDIINEKSANSSIDVKEILKELVIQQQKEMNEVMAVFNSGDTNEINSKAFVQKLIQLRKIFDAIQSIEGYYSNKSTLVKFNKGELYKNSPASNISNRKNDLGTLNSYVLDDKYNLANEESIAENFVNKTYENTEKSLRETLTTAINNIADKISAKEEQQRNETQTATQDNINSFIKNLGKEVAINKANGIVQGNITKVKSNDELVKLIISTFESLSTYNFEIDENGNLDTSALSPQELQLLYAHLNQLLIAVKQVDANNTKLTSKQKIRGKVAGVKSLNALFTNEDGKFNNSNLADGDFFDYDYSKKKNVFSMDKFENAIRKFTQQIFENTNFPQEALKAFNTGVQEGEAESKEGVTENFTKMLSNNVVSKEEYNKTAKIAKDAQAKAKAAESKVQELEQKIIEANKAKDKAIKDKEIVEGKIVDTSNMVALEEYEAAVDERDNYKGILARREIELDGTTQELEETKRKLEEATTALSERADISNDELLDRDSEYRQLYVEHEKTQNDLQETQDTLAETQKALETEKQLRESAEAVANAEKERASTAENTVDTLNTQAEKFKEIQTSTEATTKAVNEMAATLNNVTDTMNTMAQSMQNVAGSMVTAVDKMSEGINAIGQHTTQSIQKTAQNELTKKQKAEEAEKAFKTNKDSKLNEVNTYYTQLKNSNELTAANRRTIYQTLEEIINNISNSSKQTELNKAVKPFENLKTLVNNDKELRIEKDIFYKEFNSYINDLEKRGRLAKGTETFKLSKEIETGLLNSKTEKELDKFLNKFEKLKQIIKSEDDFNFNYDKVFTDFNKSVDETESKLSGLIGKTKAELTQEFNDLNNELGNLTSQKDIDDFINKWGKFAQKLNKGVEAASLSKELKGQNNEKFTDTKNRFEAIKASSKELSSEMTEDFEKVKKAFDNIIDSKTEEKFNTVLRNFKNKYSSEWGLEVFDFNKGVNGQENTLDKIEKKIQTEIKRISSSSYNQSSPEILQEKNSLKAQLELINETRAEIADFKKSLQGSGVDTQTLESNYGKIAEKINGITNSYTICIKASESFRQQISNDTVTNKISRNYEKLAADMEDFAQKNSKFLNNQYLAQQYNSILNSVKDTNNRSAKGITELQHKFAALKNEIISTGEVGYSLKDNISFLFEKIGAKAIIGSSIGYMQSALRQVVANVREIDTAMTELKKVSNESDQVYNRFLKNAGANATNLGTTMSELVSSTADFSRLGYTVQESASLAQNAVMYANVGDLDIDTATEDLVSSLKAFHMATDETSSIVDKFNEVGKIIAQIT